MTEQEAIAIIKKNYPKCCKMVNGRYKGGFDNTDCELGQAFNIAIKALEEVQQCRAIGTLEECRAAVEKQTAKRPRIIGNAMICPSCPRCFKSASPTYCPSCGQMIDWGNEE